MQRSTSIPRPLRVLTQSSPAGLLSQASQPYRLGLFAATTRSLSRCIISRMALERSTSRRNMGAEMLTSSHSLLLHVTVLVRRAAPASRELSPKPLPWSG